MWDGPLGKKSNISREYNKNFVSCPNFREKAVLILLCPGALLVGNVVVYNYH
jgi:hypothetical protein